MPAGWDHPQEDEFALCTMGIPSPYLTIVFPNQAPRHAEYLSLDGIPPKDLERWKRALRWFLQCVTAECGKRIVLKSPPHTSRYLRGSFSIVHGEAPRPQTTRPNPTPPASDWPFA